MAHVLASELRESVLQAALEGKITSTLESDTSPFESIKKFQKEKETLLQKKNMKDRNKFDSIKEKETLFEIPDTWQWIRINDIGIYKKGPFGSALTKGMFVPKSDESVKVYEQKNAIQKNWTLGEYYIKRDYYETKMSGFTVETGDIIVSCAGTIGETYIMPEGIEIGIINQALMRMNIVPSVNTDYFMLVFDHILKEEARKNSGGTAIKNIPPFEVFKAMPIPLPPIEEQARIVARVDELMAKIDEYEKLENELVELKKNFPGDMKSAVLQAAMQGKLTEQLISDSEVHRELLSTKNYPRIEELYDLPDNWINAHLEDLTNSIVTKQYQVLERDVCKEGKYPVISQSKEYSIGFTNNEERVFSPSSKIVLFGDHTTIVKTIDYPFVVGADGVKLFECTNSVLPEYLYYVLTFNASLISEVGGYSRHYKYLKNKSIPLPPIEEQQRIVEKLDKLLPLCDELCEGLYGR